ncbi:hypothetical protein ABTE09_19915, partial [Acinetobacter baumannii]
GTASIATENLHIKVKNKKKCKYYQVAQDAPRKQSKTAVPKRSGSKVCRLPLLERGKQRCWRIGKTIVVQKKFFFGFLLSMI